MKSTFNHSSRCSTGFPRVNRALLCESVISAETHKEVMASFSGTAQENETMDIVIHESDRAQDEMTQLLKKCAALQAEDRDLDWKIKENREDIAQKKAQLAAAEQHIELLRKSTASLVQQRVLHEALLTSRRNEIDATEKKITENREKYQQILQKYDAKWNNYVEEYNQFPLVPEKIQLEKELKYLNIMLAQKTQAIKYTQEKTELRNQLHAQESEVLKNKMKALHEKQEAWKKKRVKEIEDIEMKRAQLNALSEEYVKLLATASEPDREGISRQGISYHGSYLSQTSTPTATIGNADYSLSQPYSSLSGGNSHGVTAGRSSEFIIPQLTIPTYNDIEIVNIPRTKKTPPQIKRLYSEQNSLGQPSLSSTVRALLPSRTSYSQACTAVVDNTNTRAEDKQNDGGRFQLKIPSIDTEEVGKSVTSKKSYPSGISDGNPSHRISSGNEAVSPLGPAPNVPGNVLLGNKSTPPPSQIPTHLTAAPGTSGHYSKGGHMSMQNQAMSEMSKYDKKTVMTPTPSFLSRQCGGQNIELKSKQAAAIRQPGTKLSQDIFISQDSPNVRDLETVKGTQSPIHSNKAGSAAQTLRQDKQDTVTQSHNPKENAEDVPDSPQQTDANFINVEHDPAMFSFESDSPPNFERMSSPALTDDMEVSSPLSPQIITRASDGGGEPTNSSNNGGNGNFKKVFDFMYTPIANIFGGPSQGTSQSADAPQTAEAFYTIQKNSTSTFKLF